MPNKNSKYNQPAQKPVQKTGKPATQVKGMSIPEYPFWLNYAIIGSVLLVTFWCYHYSLDNHFTNWDDGLYIYENSFIKNLSPDNINRILFHDITQNYYHPLTMLSLALNWHYSGANPYPYYLTEIIIHLLNTILVFILAFSLFTAMSKKGYGKIKGIPYLAGLCALWQGIHPMHVESVSWIAERKDVLYLFFYLAGLIFYLKYINGEKISWMKYANILPIILFLWAASIVKSYSIDWKIFHSTFHVSEQLILIVLALIFAIISFVAFRYKNFKIEIFYAGEMFLFSITSKPLAVVFPLSLLAMDILLRRDNDIITKRVSEAGKKTHTFFTKWTYVIYRLVYEKTPIFILSLIFGYIAYVWQNEDGSITSFAVFTKLQRITFVGVNYLMYLFKLFVPIHLSSYYPYPELDNNNNMPLFFYIAPALAVAVTVFLLWFARKKGEKYFRVALFGFGFYFFNVMFILQYVSAGPAIMADRYSYASYVGFTFMLVYFIYVLIDKLPTYKIPLMVVVGAFSSMLAVLCEGRTQVWHNTETLWKDVISKYPAKVDTVFAPDHSQYVVHIHPGVETAYKNLGNYYVQDINPPNYDSAYMNYEILEETKSKDAGVYSNLGNIWAIRNNIKKSLEEYTKSLSLSTKSFDTYLDRGITYSRMGQNELALQDYNHAYILDSNNQRLLESRGFLLLNGIKNYPAAIADFNRLIAIEPANVDYNKNRGLAELNSGKVKDALDDFNRVVNVHPKDGECYYYFSFAYKVLKSYPTAIEYAQRAQQCGYKIPEGYIEILQKSAKESGK